MSVASRALRAETDSAKRQFIGRVGSLEPEKVMGVLHSVTSGGRSMEINGSLRIPFLKTLAASSGTE
jgi:hypothetical protein